MYNPSVEQGKDAYNEWVILHNTLNQPIDVGGWTLGGDRIIGDSEHGNGSTIIPPHGYAIVTDLNTRVYEHFMVKSEFVRLQVDDEAITPYGLNNKGDTIVLENPNGNVVDEVEYSPTWGGNGNGKTIVKENGTWIESEKVGGSLWSPGRVEIKKKIYFWESDGKRYHVPYYSITFVADYGRDWEVYTMIKEKGEEWFDEGSIHLVDGNQETQYPANKKYTFRHKESFYGMGDVGSVGHWPSEWVNNTYPYRGYTVDPYSEHIIKVYAINTITMGNYTSLFEVSSLNEDCDGDGLSDVEEEMYYNKWYSGLKYQNPDSDGDNFSDGKEIREGTNPTNKYSHPGYLFMFYINTDNTLYDVPLQDKIDDFKNINNLGKNAWITVPYDTYQKPAYRYYIGLDYSSKFLGELDMSDPNTLIDFVKWSVNNYGGTHTVLVIYSHGDAWRGLLEDDDPNEGKIMGISQLKSPMNAIKNYMERKIDITVFDACYMSNMEAAYELRGTTDIIIGSAETKVAKTENGYVVWPYKKIIEDLINNYDKYSDSYELANDTVVRFAQEFKTINDHYATMLAFDENILEEYLYPAMKNLAEYIYDNFDKVKDKIKNEISCPYPQVAYYGRNAAMQREIRYFDLESFVTHLLNYAWNDSNFTQILENVNYRLIYSPWSQQEGAIGIHVLSAQDNGCGGQQGSDIRFFSIYLFDYDDFTHTYSFDNSYKNTDFAQGTYWDELLEILVNYMNGGE